MDSSPPLGSQRTLAAIVFTDVVGFSGRMEADETTTLRLLQADTDLFRELSERHEGAVLKSTGDGLLCYFNSAVQAVSCALAFQRALAARPKPAEGTFEPLVHRIGIHLGDIFIIDNDVQGDGVNIAARLQAEAAPGGICVSQTVYDVVKNKLELRATFMGERELKNIRTVIPIYQILLGEGERAVSRIQRRSGSAGTGWKVAVGGLAGALTVALGVIAFGPGRSQVPVAAPDAAAGAAAKPVEVSRTDAGLPTRPIMARAPRTLVQEWVLREIKGYTEEKPAAIPGKNTPQPEVEAWSNADGTISIRTEGKVATGRPAELSAEHLAQSAFAVLIDKKRNGKPVERIISGALRAFANAEGLKDPRLLGPEAGTKPLP